MPCPDLDPSHPFLSHHHQQPPHKKKKAYCLSPLIYSATVKLHPVLIVAALYMMEHLAGLQGVFLAVPITMFVIKQVSIGEEELACVGRWGVL